MRRDSAGVGDEPAKYSSVVNRIIHGGVRDVDVITSANNPMESDHHGKQKKYYSMSLVSYSQMKAFSHIHTNEELAKKNQSP